MTAFTLRKFSKITVTDHLDYDVEELGESGTLLEPSTYGGMTTWTLYYEGDAYWGAYIDHYDLGACGDVRSAASASVRHLQSEDRWSA